MRRKSLQNWQNCGWSGTQQQHSKHEAKRTVILKTSIPVEFSQSTHENDEQFTVERRNCGWSGTRQQHRMHETGTKQQGRKIR
jgi:hypothetical protein